MGPTNSMKENGDYPQFNTLERNSLITMLLLGRQYRRRGENERNEEHRKVYPPMNPRVKCGSTQHQRRTRQNSLDVTLHTTSHVMGNDVVDRDTHDTENKLLFLTNEDCNAQLAASLEFELFMSIDLSNITNVSGHIGPNIGASVLCVKISTNFAQLQSLCLHNCQIDDTCAKSLASIITSEGNVLKFLNLSKNMVSDVGTKALLDAMKSHHCWIQELDLSQNQLTLTGISSFAQNLSVFLHLKTLRLGDSEQLVPVYIFQQFAAAIEKNVILHTLTLGSQVLDGTVNESHGEHAVTKKQKIDDVLLSFWHEPLFTAVTDHIRSLLQQNHSGIGALMSTNQIDIDTLQSVINAAKPEKQVDTCFRLLRLKPDILLAFG